MAEKNALTAITFAGAVVADWLNAGGIAVASLGGAMLAEALGRVMARRAETARKILEDELRAGDRTLDEQDLEGAAAISFRFARAAHEGAARLNLRLLAAVFSGQIVRKEIVADEFLSFADILAPLRRNEIIYLGLLLKHGAFSDALGINAFREATAAVMYDEQIQSVGCDMFEVQAVAQSLLRTGLVSAEFHGGALGGGTTTFFGGTVRLRRLQALVDIEAVVVRHDAAEATAP